MLGSVYNKQGLRMNLCPTLTGNSWLKGNNCNPLSSPWAQAMCNVWCTTLGFIQMPKKADSLQYRIKLVAWMASQWPECFSMMPTVTRNFLLKLFCDSINHFVRSHKQKGKTSSRSFHAYISCYCIPCFSLQYFVTVSSCFCLEAWLIDLFSSTILSFSVK